MNQELVYHVVSFIPKGRVLTYQKLAQYSGIKNPRLVGNILHKNSDPLKIPCHRVVNIVGGLAQNYAFGGKIAQRKKLESEGVIFRGGNVNLQESLWHSNPLLTAYFSLLNQFGFPGPWPWFGKDSPHTLDEIAIGAILTQNTNWLNVQKSLDRLREEHLNDLQSLHQICLKEPQKVKELIKSSGFFNQKASYLAHFCQFIYQNYKDSKSFFNNQNVIGLRKELLFIKGIGPETADTILLYCNNLPIFVIDSYTKRFVQNHQIDIKPDYQELQKFFMEQLTKDVKLYQDFHALIVQWAKNNK